MKGGKGFEKKAGRRRNFERRGKVFITGGKKGFTMKKMRESTSTCPKGKKSLAGCERLGKGGFSNRRTGKLGLCERKIQRWEKKTSEVSSRGVCGRKPSMTKTQVVTEACNKFRWEGGRD